MKSFVLSFAAILFFVLHAWADTFTVTSGADPGDGVCDPSGVGDGCTLREAITTANGNLNPTETDTIGFNIPGSGVHTIRPNTLPAITEPVVIDGYTQPGAAANTQAVGGDAILLIELDGGISSRALILATHGSVLRGLVINRGIQANISVQGDGNTIEGCYINTTSDGTAIAPFSSSFYGVELNGGGTTARNTVIGGASPAARNLICGHYFGIGLATESNVSGTRIQGNYIGVDKTGAVDLGNTNAGIDLSATPDNTIGGAAPGAGNVISGNDIVGIAGNGTSGTIVQGNRVGTNAAGSAAVPNGNGLIFSGDANVIGGSETGAGNVFSGNLQWGATIGGTGTVIKGNLIGTNSAGTAPVPNGFGGLQLTSIGAVIGGTAVGDGNVISGNSGGPGIALGGGISFSTSNNLLQGNFIGTDRSGTRSLGNAFGIEANASNISYNVIGGREPGAANVIAHNSSAGVLSYSFDGIGNPIVGNRIYGNGGLGIDFSVDGHQGPTPNDPGDADDGPNNLQNFPDLGAFSQSGDTVVLNGTLDSVAGAHFTIDCYANSKADNSGFGEGESYLGSTGVTTDAQGHGAFSFVLPASAVGQFITSTAATDAVPANVPSPTPHPAQALNISTRAQVGALDSALIGGFIITGNGAKKVILRAIGPSLAGGVSTPLLDPVLELHEPDGTVVTNDNWRNGQEAAILDSGLAPSNDLESAIIRVLNPGAYTAVVRGKNGGVGVGLVDAYDLDQTVPSAFGNISTRAFVGTGSDVLIGGITIGEGDDPHATILVRALGPSLADLGVSIVLADPALELHNAEGDLIAGNDDWKSTQKSEIAATGLAPAKDKESALLATVASGQYTVVVLGVGEGVGVGLVEVYHLE